MDLLNSSSDDEDSPPVQTPIKPVQTPIATKKAYGKRAPSEGSSHRQEASNGRPLLKKRCHTFPVETPPTKKSRVQPMQSAEQKIIEQNCQHQHKRKPRQQGGPKTDSSQSSTLFKSPHRKREVQPSTSPDSPASPIRAPQPGEEGTVLKGVNIVLCPNLFSVDLLQQFAKQLDELGGKLFTEVPAKGVWTSYSQFHMCFEGNETAEECQVFKRSFSRYAMQAQAGLHGLHWLRKAVSENRVPPESYGPFKPPPREYTPAVQVKNAGAPSPEQQRQKAETEPKQANNSFASLVSKLLGNLPTLIIN
jgi:hypothetical protein